ncbi:MAG: PQQ-binding-like beta-propeller repeat protein [Verrucomicrobia bacterium]|nr:PQQ-binding-like beta-propeller repeat protein [Verrucomicrobiota bacterium]
MGAEPAPKFAPGKAAVLEERETKRPSQTFLLKTDADLDALMVQGNQLAATGQHGAAIEIFQGLIEKAEDRVVAVSGEDGADESTRLFLPATDAARRALLAGSKALRAEYAARFEGQAAAQVEVALAANDTAVLARTAAMFPATVAAQRARWWCGALLADAGDFASAAAVWDEFLALQPTMGSAGADLPLTLAQQSLALARSGQLAGARGALARLEKESPTARRRIGGSEQSVVECARRAIVAMATVEGDVVFPETFAPTPQWRAQTDSELAPFARVSGGRAFVRTLKSIACLEIATGKRLWEMPAAMQPLAAPSSRVHISGGMSEREVAGQQRFVVAAAPEMVCFVENSPDGAANIEVRGVVMFGGPGPVMPQPRKFAGSSQLTARDARSGRLRWRVGQGEGRDEFSRVARWISPPTIIGDRVFIIALHIQSYHLVCLDAADGRKVWHKLISHRLEGGLGWQGGVEMASASALRVTAGRILCLTNGGVFACFDQLTGEPRWFCQYTALMISGVNVMPPTKLAAVNPILAHERVAVILPADTDQVMAFDIGSGRMLWRQPREQQRFLVGVASEDADAKAVVVLSGTSAAARTLDDGKPVWNKLLEAGAGRPVLRHGKLYALTQSRGVVQIDAQSGREVCSSPIPAGEFRHFAEGDTSLMAIGSRSVAALRSFAKAIEEMARHVESAPDDPRRWRERGELNLQSARIPEAIEDLTKARALQQKACTGRAETDALLFRCNMEMAARDSGKSLAWLERAGAYTTTAVARSERWLRIADAQETRGNWAAAREALQQILDHETGAWLDVPGSSEPSGARLVGGRVLNRSVAAQRLERLVEAHGRGVAVRVETTARRRLTEAIKHRDARGLAEIVVSYPVGEAHEQAWLALAAQEFLAREFDETAETLLWLLRAEPAAARRGDAALGVTLAGVRAGRGSLARHGLALMEALTPKARLSFGGVTGTAATLRRTLSQQAPSAEAAREVGQGNEEDRKPGREIGLLRGADDLAGGRLFIENRKLVRVAPDGARVMWTSMEVVEKRGRSDSPPVAGVLLDTVLLFRGSQAVALDADTGKLLWQEHGVRLENLPDVRGSEVLQRMVALVIASGRSPTPGWRMMFVAGNQLFRVKTSGEIALLSPRSGKAVWSVRLPEAVGVWAAATVRESGSYVALVAGGGGSATEFRVAVLDAMRGRLLALWDVPKDRPDFAIRADGRVQLVESEESKSATQK